MSAIYILVVGLQIKWVVEECDKLTSDLDCFQSGAALHRDNLRKLKSLFLMIRSSLPINHSTKKQPVLIPREDRVTNLLDIETD